ncbi:hypothetical protein [Blastomonas natatoria]|uniref:hypothetical protein n=1 Tax=Blastomonas natatoria TaxID=34015 RepID=UPI001ABFA25D|nr:hypothetical protein [Blastomonas natatoria]
MRSAFWISSPDERADRNKERGKAQKEKPDFLVSLRAFALCAHFRFVHWGRSKDARGKTATKTVGLSRCAKKLKPLHPSGVNAFLTIAYGN